MVTRLEAIVDLLFCALWLTFLVLVLASFVACGPPAGEVEARAAAEQTFGVDLRPWRIEFWEWMPEVWHIAGGTYCGDRLIVLADDDWKTNALCHEAAHIAEGCGTNPGHVGWSPGVDARIAECQNLIP